jgi:hypothetical protein
MEVKKVSGVQYKIFAGSLIDPKDDLVIMTILLSQVVDWQFYEQKLLYASVT